VDTSGVNPLSDRDQRRAPAVLELHMTLPAQLATPSVARERLGRWLAAHGWPSGQYDDLVLAVSEAVSNSVEHGYGVDHAGAGHEGLVEVHGVVQTDGEGRRRAVLTVLDHGSWLPPSTFRGNRRHGLPLMEACVDSMTVDGTGQGTTVVLHSRPVPPPLDPG
jgi:anti-sigma regulatory factor (Ser/Thr protein kinase)